MHRHDLDYTFVVIKPSQLEVFGENGDRLFDFWAEGTKAFKIKVSKFSIKTILYQHPSLGLCSRHIHTVEDQTLQKFLGLKEIFVAGWLFGAFVWKSAVACAKVSMIS